MAFQPDYKYLFTDPEWKAAWEEAHESLSPNNMLQDGQQQDVLQMKPVDQGWAHWKTAKGKDFVPQIELLVAKDMPGKKTPIAEAKPKTEELSKASSSTPVASASSSNSG